MTTQLAVFICCSYNKSLCIAFDAAKSVTNELKHGVRLSLAAQIDWSAVWSEPDVRRDYGELREVGDRGQALLRGIHAARRRHSGDQSAQGQLPGEHTL